MRSRGDSELGLRRDHGCVRDLMWRCDLPEDTDLQELILALEGEGFHVEDPGPLLRILRRSDGDAIVIVPRTRRIQVRVSYAVPVTKRADRAREVVSLIARAAEQGPARP